MCSNALAANPHDGTDKLIKALRFMLSKQHEKDIKESADNARKFNILVGGIYQNLASLTSSFPSEMLSCVKVGNFFAANQMVFAVSNVASYRRTAWKRSFTLDPANKAKARITKLMLLISNRALCDVHIKYC